VSEQESRKTQTKKEYHIMKITNCLLAVVLVATLTGCASDSAKKVAQIDVGDKRITFLVQRHHDPFGTDAVTQLQVQSDLKVATQQSSPSVVMVQPPLVVATQPVAVQPVQELLTNTHVINSNNQGSPGWAGVAFNGAVGDALIGGSMMGAARLIRPTSITASGGSSSASACASACAVNE
jgi:hypothetical protein